MGSTDMMIRNSKVECLQENCDWKGSIVDYYQVISKTIINNLIAKDEIYGPYNIWLFYGFRSWGGYQGALRPMLPCVICSLIKIVQKQWKLWDLRGAIVRKYFDYFWFNLSVKNVFRFLSVSRDKMSIYFNQLSQWQM